MSLDVMNLLLVLLAALGGGWVARRVGYPSILGELGAGILLGPPLLGLLQPDDALAVIGKLGVVLLMLYIGLHLDPGSLGKASRPGGLAALGGFLVPAGLGFALMMLVDGDPIAATFVATAMGVTSLATKSRILVDLGILHTRIAHVLMAGALFSDVAALIVFAALLGFAATGGLALSGIAASAGSAALFLAGAWLVGTRVFPAAGRRLADRRIEPGRRFGPSREVQGRDPDRVGTGLRCCVCAPVGDRDAVEHRGAHAIGSFRRRRMRPRRNAAPQRPP